MPTKKTTVLVVDDDKRLLRMMQRTLELEGYHVTTAINGEDALDIITSETAQLVLLDVMMPGIDGYTVCQRIRELSTTPIIMISAKGDDEEKIKGLNAGADDYVTKPFATKVLVARIRAALRRSTVWGEDPGDTFNHEDLTLDFHRRTVFINNESINLTATEYKVLSYLAHNVNRVLTADQILEKVWGVEYLGEINILQANIARLRKKLNDDAKKPKYILTRPGIGYTIITRTLNNK